MRIYILVKHYEAPYDYGWDYTPFELIEANTSKRNLENKCFEYEQCNGGATWEEDDFTCYYTIEEIGLEN